MQWHFVSLINTPSSVVGFESNNAIRLFVDETLHNTNWEQQWNARYNYAISSNPIQFILWHNSKIKYNQVHENKVPTGHNNANSEHE